MVVVEKKSPWQAVEKKVAAVAAFLMCLVVLAVPRLWTTPNFWNSRLVSCWSTWHFGTCVAPTTGLPKKAADDLIFGQEQRVTTDSSHPVARGWRLVE